MRLKKGDLVKIITGKDKGKEGKILRVYPKDDKVLVEGLNLFKKHQKPKRQGEKGEIIQLPRPLNVSNVMLICSSCKESVKAAYKFLDDDKKRVCKKCGSEI